MTAVAASAPSGSAPAVERVGRVAANTSALILLATVQLMVVLDTTIVNVALPSVERALAFGLGDIAWVVNATR